MINEETTVQKSEEISSEKLKKPVKNNKELTQKVHIKVKFQYIYYFL